MKDSCISVNVWQDKLKELYVGYVWNVRWNYEQYSNDIQTEKC